MNRIEEKLLFYNDLSSDERAEVDAYLAENPEVQPLMEELRRLGELFDNARAMMEEPIQDDALVYYVVTRCYSRAEIPVPLQEVFDRVDDRIAADASLRARYEHFVERLRSVEEESDPAEQFERLAGFRAGPHKAPSRDRKPPARQRSAVRRIPVVGSFPVSARWAAAAIVTLVVLYGALSALSVAVTPEHERLAAFDEAELQIEGFDVRGRGETGEAPSIDTLYLDTLALLVHSRSSTLGLFPRFDENVLSSAEERLEQVVAETESGSFVQLDALYFLGKVRLAQGNIAEAQRALQQVVRGEGRLSEEAYNILARLAADEAY